MNPSFRALALVSVFGAAGIAHAQVWPGTPMPTKWKDQEALRALSLTDQGFVKAAAEAFRGGESLGELALDRGTSSTVKKLGRNVEVGQKRLADQFKNLTAREGIVLPDDASHSEQDRVQRLRDLPEAEFNRAFLQEQQRDLDEEVELFRTESTSGTDASLRTFARQHIGELRQQARSVSAVTGRHSGTEVPARIRDADSEK